MTDGGQISVEHGPWRWLAKVTAAAAALVLVVNAWLAVRLEALLLRTSAGDLTVLDQRVAGFPDRERVRVLVLGSSHAMFAFQAPVLGPALGLTPDAVFCQALGGVSAFEARVLERRYREAFPKARLALVLLDETMVARSPRLQEARKRLLTRFDPVERMRFASYFPRLEERVALLAWMPMPLADFNTQLMASWRAAPGEFVRTLVGAGVEPAAPDARARQLASPYRWGFPLVDWQSADELRKRHAAERTTAAMRQRARLFLDDMPGLERGLEEIEGLCRNLEARGCRVQLVGAPLPLEFRRELARVRAAELAAFDRALARYLASSGRSLERLPDLPFTAFLDADHVNEAGARASTMHLLARRPWLRGLVADAPAAEARK